MQNSKKGLNISARSFIIAIAVIFCLMVLTYALTFLVPSGEFARIPDANGHLIVDTEAGFHYTDSGISFAQWLLSPVLVLTAEGSGTILAVLVFLLVVGGIFNSLEKGGLMHYMLGTIIRKYGHRKYTLIAVISLFFMVMGAMVGSFEECVPMVPIVVALAVGLGWDSLTGIGMSILAAGCGFASGVCNPFTVGVAQELAGLPMFSGALYRLFAFVLIYILLNLFLGTHAKHVEKPVSDISSLEKATDPKMDRAIRCFAVILGTGIFLVLLSPVIPALQDFTMIIVAVMFLLAGLVSVRVSGMSRKTLGSTFLHGVLSILPAVLMILMASSIRYIMTTAGILDTLLYYAMGVASHLPRAVVLLFIYLIVLVMNFFIASGSAKAFLLIPLIVPLAEVFGISPQLCILAFAFGDGFSNVFYPTNPVLLISLGMSDVDYGSWVRYSGKFQLANLLLTSLILLLGLLIY